MKRSVRASLSAGFALLFAVLPCRAADGYAALVARAKAGQRVDFTALRMAYAALPGHSVSDEALEKMLEKLGRDLDKSRDLKDKAGCRKTIEETDKVLDAYYISIHLHGLRLVCFQTLGDRAQAMREDRIVTGILQSILAKGDGSSPDNAIVVVSRSEEEYVLDMNGFEEELSRKTMVRGGHHFDVLDRLSKMVGDKTFYFRTD